MFISLSVWMILVDTTVEWPKTDFGLGKKGFFLNADRLLLTF
jgi:hypothetical protein